MDSIDLRFGFVALEELLDLVRTHPLSDGRCVPVCLWGSRGIGKTQVLESYARERGLELCKYHPAHDTTGSDIVGIPFIDEQTERTAYALPDWLPQDGPDNHGGVFFIDEINRAGLAVLQGLMEVLGEGSIAQSGWKLPPSWIIVCAANPPGQDYDVNRMDEAMMDRLLHFNFTWNAPSWTVWAEGSGIDAKVVDFALQNPDLIEGGFSELPMNIQPVATPRALEYLGALYSPDMELRMLRVIGQGLIGREGTEQMIEKHLDPEQPLSGEQIVSGGFDEVIKRWRAESREDLMLASTARLAGLLQTREPARNLAAQRTGQWLAALSGVSQELFRNAISLMADSTPGWLALILSDDEHDLMRHIPRNEALLRQAALRGLSAQRQQRNQRRRIDEAAAQGEDMDDWLDTEFTA